jgi:hypothetical protein
MCHNRKTSCVEVYWKATEGEMGEHEEIGNTSIKSDTTLDERNSRRIEVLHVVLEMVLKLILWSISHAFYFL